MPLAIKEINRRPNNKSPWGINPRALQLPSTWNNLKGISSILSKAHFCEK
jgi:hypothetical protein